MNIVGLSISQWLPCPLAIWAFGLDGKSCYILLNLVYLELNLALRSLGPSGFHSVSAFSSLLLIIRATPSVCWSSDLPEKSMVCPDANFFFPAPVHLASLTPRMSSL